MGNICGCDLFDKKVGMNPPVPTNIEPMLPPRATIPSTPSLLDIDVTSVLIGAVGASVLFYLIFGSFWRRD